MGPDLEQELANGAGDSAPSVTWWKKPPPPPPPQFSGLDLV